MDNCVRSSVTRTHPNKADWDWVGVQLRKALDRLIAEHLVAWKSSTYDGQLGEFLYVTGRNPVVALEERARETQQRVRAGNFTWSRLF